MRYTHRYRLFSARRAAFQTGAVLLALLSGACIARPAEAQEAEETAPALPDITPQVVEIRAGLDISLPSLQRQPLIGFNPPPRVASVPADRRPWVESYKQKSADLPESPLATLEPAPAASLTSGVPGRGMAEAGGGRYLGRTMRLRAEGPLSRRGAFRARLDYAGSEGHSSADMPDNVSASFDAFEALVGMQQQTGPVSFGLDLEGFAHARRMYGALPATGPVGPVEAAESAEPAPMKAAWRYDAGHTSDLKAAPVRRGQGGGGALWIKTNDTGRARFEARAQYRVQSSETDALPEDLQDDDHIFQRSESTLALESALTLPVAKRSDVMGTVHMLRLGFDDEAPGGISMLDFGAAMQMRPGPALRIDGGLRFMTFAERDSAASSWIAPNIRLDFQVLPAVQVYARNDARAEHRSTRSMYRENPFLLDRPRVQPDVYTLDLRVGSRIQVGAIGFDAYGGYANAPNYRYFEAASLRETEGYAQGMMAARYAAATIAYGGGDISFHLPAKWSFVAGFSVRNGALKEDDTDIPYFGAVTGHGGLSWFFRNGRGFLQATLDYESARRPAVAETDDLDGYLDMNLSALYPVTRRIGALLRLDNILAGSAARWEYYDRTPFGIALGARMQW